MESFGSDLSQFIMSQKALPNQTAAENLHIFMQGLGSLTSQEEALYRLTMGSLLNLSKKLEYALIIDFHANNVDARPSFVQIHARGSPFAPFPKQVKAAVSAFLLTFLSKQIGMTVLLCVPCTK